MIYLRTDRHCVHPSSILTAEFPLGNIFHENQQEKVEHFIHLKDKTEFLKKSENYPLFQT